MLLLLATVWATYVFNRLWREGLLQEVQGAFEAARELGLAPVPTRWRARLVVEGALGSRQVRVEWRGGARGSWSRLSSPGQTSRLPLLRSPAELHLALRQAGLDPG